MKPLTYILTLFIFTFNLTNTFAADNVHFTKHDGYKRKYIVHTPPSFSKDKQYPVVMVFHGGGGNAEGVMRQTSMNKTADKNDFIAVYPEGISSLIGNFHTWNAKECCGRAQKKNIDDVGFISQLINLLAQDYNIDKTRVYATGHSNGAMMSYQLACKIPNKIAAIAPNGGNINVQNCNNSRTIPVLHIHGIEDKCANYYGAKKCGSCFGDIFKKTLGLPNMQKSRICHPVPKISANWATKNNCSSSKKVTFQKGAVTCETWQGCDAPVTLCSIKDAGHTWAGSVYGAKICTKKPNSKTCNNYKSIVGTINRDINASDFMWNFFKNHSL